MWLSEFYVFSLIFSNTTSFGYWVLFNIAANINGAEKKVISDFEIYAPYGFSYHCGDHTFKSEDFYLLIKDFQVSTNSLAKNH